MPHVEGYSELTQLNGLHIMQLKSQWPCSQHPGEHGEPGYCFVTPGGEHIGLNNRKQKIWGAAMVRECLFSDLFYHFLHADGSDFSFRALEMLPSSSLRTLRSLMLLATAATLSHVPGGERVLTPPR